MGHLSLYMHLNKQQNWIGHGDLTFTYVTCIVAIGHHLFQALQKCFQKTKNSTMLRNNYLELNKVTLVEWVDKALL